MCDFVCRTDIMSQPVAYPPEEWDIFPEDEFNTTAFETTQEGLEASLLVQVTRAAKVEGLFRVCLAGGANVTVEVRAGKVLPVDTADQYKLALEVRPGDLKFQPNAFSTAWVDVADG